MTAKNCNRQSFMAKIKASLFNLIVKPSLAVLLLTIGINSSSVTASSLEKTVQETKTEKQPEENKTASKQSQNEITAEETTDALDSNTADSNTSNSNSVNSQKEDTGRKTSADENSLSSQPDSTNSSSDISISGNSISDNSNSQVSDSLPSSIIDLDQWRFLHQYTASYDIISDGDRLGRASRTLRKDDKGWKLEISTKLKKWLLTLRSNEFSRFRIVDNQLKTDEFYTSTKVSFKDPRIVQQHFDWKNQLEQGRKNKRKWELPLDELLYDRMSHFVKLRADLLSDSKDFKYTVSYKGSRKSYEYVANGNEVLKTPMGNIETIRFDRVSGDDSSFSIWLSPDYNYFPIKIAQVEQDKPDVTLALTKLEFVPAPAASE